MKERVLVVAAHPDDESFGCLGTLLQHKERGDEIAFQWFTSGKDEKQASGMEKVLKYFKANKYGNRFHDQALDMVPLTALIENVEQAVQLYRPTIVYTNFIADLNKDHRLVSEAVMVACRPYKPNTPRVVYMFFINGTTELGFRKFNTTSTVPIDGPLKTRLIKEWYPDELKNERQYISDDESFERWPK